jgi:hypothetical protein
MYGWKLLWAKDAEGEIGKTPQTPAGCVELDWTHGSILEAFGNAGRKVRR